LGVLDVWCCREIFPTKATAVNSNFPIYNDCYFKDSEMSENSISEASPLLNSSKGKDLENPITTAKQQLSHKLQHPKNLRI
jgi:hypothetical protein